MNEVTYWGGYPTTIKCKLFLIYQTHRINVKIILIYCKTIKPNLLFHSSHHLFHSSHQLFCIHLFCHPAGPLLLLSLTLNTVLYTLTICNLKYELLIKIILGILNIINAIICRVEIILFDLVVWNSQEYCHV